MKNKYLLEYLKGYYNDAKMDHILDYFKVDFDYYLYAYGSQFSPRNNFEERINHQYIKLGEYKKRTKKTRKQLSTLGRIKENVYSFVSKLQDKRNKRKADAAGGYMKVLFVEPMTLNTKAKFFENNIRIVCLDEYNNKEYPEIYSLFKWYKGLEKLSFNERLKLERYDCLDHYISVIQETFADFDGLFVGNDEYFLCKLFIDAFKGINIPTYNWTHGFPCSSSIHERVDFQLVWGQGIKDYLVKAGKDKDSIIVSGNIHYFDVPTHTDFRNSLDDILVLTSVSVANLRHTWDYTTFENWDRSLLITYIYSVEKVLKGLGIKHARLRPHPINNYPWIEKFIDTDFYEIDTLSLNDSLDRATLAIGPTSSTFVESMRKGLTYLVYEPGDGHKSMIGLKLEPPFDGSDQDLRVAFNETQLEELIKCHYSCNQNILDKYIIPFDFASFKHTLGRKLV